MLLTDVSDDAGHDDLGFVGRPDGVAEVGVVPGIDLALPLDERRVRIHVEDFLWQGAVGTYRLSLREALTSHNEGKAMAVVQTCLGGCRHHNREAK